MKIKYTIALLIILSGFLLLLVPIFSAIFSATDVVYMAKNRTFDDFSNLASFFGNIAIIGSQYIYSIPFGLTLIFIGLYIFSRTALCPPQENIDGPFQKFVFLPIIIGVATVVVIFMTPVLPARLFHVFIWPTIGAVSIFCALATSHALLPAPKKWLYKIQLLFGLLTLLAVVIYYFGERKSFLKEEETRLRIEQEILKERAFRMSKAPTLPQSLPAEAKPER